MLIRAFRNDDPPGLAALWASQNGIRGIASCVTPQVLDAFVFSKPYFDRHGLIIAEHEGKIVGFAHAGFGPNDTYTDISTELGTTCMVMLAPHFRGDQQLARQLLDASEAYLHERGAKVLYAGCIRPLNPFYLGFYGGSELPGVMQSDQMSVQLFQQAGYEEIDRVVMLDCNLLSFRAPVDRQQLQNRRRFCVELETEAGERSWWDACSGPISESARFVVFPAEGGPPAGSVVFWIMEPMSTTYGHATAGLTQLVIEEPYQRKGLATFLNAEAMRQLQMGGLANVEVQTMIGNTPALGLYQKLGFREYDQGLVMRKAA